MTFILAVCVAVIFAVSVYLLLGKELKGVVMGIFLISHAANLCILAQSGSPVTNSPTVGDDRLKAPPVLDHGHYPGHAGGADALTTVVDPLPQALILTAIVISFAVMAFLLTLVVITARNAETLDIDGLAQEDRSPPSAAH